ncbi:hypothetical protein PISMIDRAFT_117361 [Pisolithus microcarpus 441]|uniref:HAT C-terminal dimerisation domain-containing protein n=1 Tax=Pisolithus microcarpus 441 TaxID=765257 RepID=A0A0C9YK63_9AGAM|nr:hypothetical protein PISMIDRAFT_117361 [Pisolithus microcarpus 441]
MYPCLSRMALDYLSIPATSVDIKHLFSKGRVFLPYLRNCMSSQTTCALMCLSHWSKLHLIKDEDLRKVVSAEPELPGNCVGVKHVDLELADE